MGRGARDMARERGLTGRVGCLGGLLRGLASPSSSCRPQDGRGDRCLAKQACYLPPPAWGWSGLGPLKEFLA